MKKPLPPKTCTIERLITKPEEIKRVLTGEKCSIRRNGRYADPGEVMRLDGKEYEVIRVYQQTLGEMEDQHAQSEGFSTMEEYKKHILAIHPKMPWLPQMTVWVHDFRPL